MSHSSQNSKFTLNPLILLLSILAVVILSRVMVFNQIYQQTPQSVQRGDTNRYEDPALHLLQHGSLAINPTDPRTTALSITPLYPLFIAGTYKIFGEKTTDLKDIIKFVKEKEEINIFEFYLICPLWEYYIDYSYLHIGNVNALNLFTAEKEFSDNEFYSSIFKELVVRTTDDAIEKIHKKRNAKGKSFKEIILDRFEEIDEENMYKINESMYNLIYSVREEFGYKRITKQIINKWITVYQEIKKEKEA